jgi:hypothetical protein
MLECDDIFDLACISVEHKVNWGIVHIRRHAKTCLNSATLNLQSNSWTELCIVLLDHFPDVVSYDPMYQLQILK